MCCLMAEGGDDGVKEGARPFTEGVKRNTYTGEPERSPWPSGQLAMKLDTPYGLSSLACIDDVTTSVGARPLLSARATRFLWSLRYRSRTRLDP